MLPIAFFVRQKKGYVLVCFAVFAVCVIDAVGGALPWAINERK